MGSADATRHRVASFWCGMTKGMQCRWALLIACGVARRDWASLSMTLAGSSPEKRHMGINACGGELRSWVRGVSGEGPAGTILYSLSLQILIVFCIMNAGLQNNLISSEVIVMHPAETRRHQRGQGIRQRGP
jgi:hypothetical protein